MKRVLHLASWYPNRNEPQAGDFIKRQLQAVSAYESVHVIALIKDPKLKKTMLDVQQHDEGNLHQTIVYYNSLRTGIHKLDQVISFLSYQLYSKKLVRRHFAKHGKPELIHVHVAFRAGLTALWIKKRFGILYLLTEHWTGYKASAAFGLHTQGKVVQRLTKKILAGATMVLPVSESLAGDLKKVSPGLKCVIIPNVVDESLFFARAATAPDKLFRFLHVSTMGVEKRPKLMFEAFDQFRKETPAELVCLGTVPAGLMEWVATNITHDTAIIFRGNITYEEVATEMRAADCLLIASSNESFSCVAVEALLSGIPVIATRVGILPEVINPANGILFDHPEELLTAMHRIYSNQTAYLPELIAGSQKGNFSYQTIAAKLLDVYNSCAPLNCTNPGESR